MLYLGEFAFDGTVENIGEAVDGPCHGRFSMLAEADTADLAMAKFAALI